MSREEASAGRGLPPRPKRQAGTLSYVDLGWMGDTGVVAQQRSTFAKLQREREKKEKAVAKADRRARQAASAAETSTQELDPEHEAAILAGLAELHAAFEQGSVSIDEFEDRREQLSRRLQIG